MERVKYVCEHCGKARKYSTKEFILISLGNALATFFIMGGLLLLFYIFLVGWELPMNHLVNYEFNSINENVDENLRLLVMNITMECDGDNAQCYGRELFANLTRIRYVKPSLQRDYPVYDPLYVYEHGGDCKNLANMYVAMMRSVGFKAWVDCSIEHKHCVAVFPNYSFSELKPNYWVVDLTSPTMKQKLDNESVWE